METRSKHTRDLALSEDVIPPAEFPARMGESTPESGYLGNIGHDRGGWNCRGQSPLQH